MESEQGAVSVDARVAANAVLAPESVIELKWSSVLEGCLGGCMMKASTIFINCLLRKRCFREGFLVLGRLKVPRVHISWVPFIIPWRLAGGFERTGDNN